VNDLEVAMGGIEFRHSRQLVDEIPSAYKNIDEGVQNAKSLIEVQPTLRQFVNVKSD
jgi:tRNA-splicing ligase RtcB